jgi:HPt (histidine-containing phosphotransfer) domain-containing protein
MTQSKREAEMNSNDDKRGIEMSTFNELQESAGLEFVIELIEAFVDDAPRQLQAMRDALSRGDEATFRRGAHTLKSNGNTFGAHGFSALARQLELSKMSELAAEGQVLLQRLEGEYQRAAQALQELCHAT